MKLQSIQFLRAVAAGLVVYVHAIDLQAMFGTSRQQQFLSLKNFGSVGVDLFFVISGFIISLVSAQYAGPRAGARFMRKRFFRINPAYYIASFLFLLFLAILQPGGLLGLLSPAAPAWQHFLNTLLILPVFPTMGQCQPTLGIGWTLSFEYLFYLLFLLLIFARIRSKSLSFALLIPLLVLAGFLFRPTDFRLVFLTNPMLLEFLFGVLLHRLYLRHSLPVQVARCLIGAGLLGYAFSIWHGFGRINDPIVILVPAQGLRRVIAWGIPSAAIVTGCLFLEQKQKRKYIWNIPILQSMGNASYSIYLIHSVVFLLLQAIYTQFGFFLPADLAIWVQWFLAVAAGFVLYDLVEKPLLMRLNAPSAPASPPPSSI